MTKFVIGKIEAAIATLINDEMQLVDFPASLLPENVNIGSVLNVQAVHNLNEEEKELLEFKQLQNEIKEKYGKFPSSPKLSVKSVTQTSIEVEWKVNLEKCILHTIDCYVNNIQSNSFLLKSSCSLKIGGLQMDKKYEIFIVLRTSGGILKSNSLTQKTLAITDLCGLVVAFNINTETQELKDLVESFGAKTTPDFSANNTHLISLDNSGNRCKFAGEMNIPVITPRWLIKCKEEGKMVPVRDFYP